MCPDNRDNVIRERKVQQAAVKPQNGEPRGERRYRSQRTGRDDFRRRRVGGHRPGSGREAALEFYFSDCMGGSGEAKRYPVAPEVKSWTACASCDFKGTSWS
jgi:hypothetical protein